MSTGNDNFITLDSIAEIQDIVNGDYLFTISNGVIYKLDFQNFIIGKQNTDFFTTIDTLSAQVVSNTQSLCAINAYLNEIKPSLDEIDSLYTTVNELSSNWNATYSTVNTLSSQAFLPISNDTNNIQAGSMLYYNGENSRFVTLPPGGISQVLSITDNGIPGFTDSTGASENTPQILKTGSEPVLTASNGNSTSRTFYDETKSFTIYNSSDTAYKNVRIATNINIRQNVGTDSRETNKNGYLTTGRIEITYGNGTIAPKSNGIAVIETLPAGSSIKARVTVEGGTPVGRGGFSVITFNYTINGVEDLPPA